MKCPHCGIEIRDTMTVCMYCGGKIPQRKGAVPPVAGKAPDTLTRPSSKAGAAKTGPAKGIPDTEGEGDEEDEGGLSAYLQPGEQVLIGSLNITVKKFYFHAYLTDRRIFLIDTQEKKLKVTAKDIPLDTIIENSVESSENSDPVLVLSIRSADDEIKTMKLVFAGNGMDRSGEVDEWVELLNEQGRPKKQKKPAPQKRREVKPEISAEEDEGEQYEEEVPPEPVRPQRAVSAQDPRPVKRPVKDHEKQPPVKRLLSLYKTEPEEEELPPAAAPIREPGKPSHTAAPSRKAVSQQAPLREMPPSREPKEASVKKVEVQSAMKGAMRGALEPSSKTPEKTVHRPVTVSAVKKPVRPEPEPEPALAFHPDEEPGFPDEISGEDTAGPLFCHNCGKKLPGSANFCPGCGSKILAHKEKQPRKVHERSSQHRQEESSEPPAPAEEPRTVKPPVKKAPKGSEMTILHKFLRR